MPSLIKKALLITLAFGLLGLAAGYAFLTTASFREMARTRAQEWFDDRFRGRLQIRELEWYPFSNSAVIRDLEIRDPESPDDQPAVRLKQAVVNFSLIRLLSPSIDLQELVLDGLQVRVRREVDDRINLARVFERREAQASPSSSQETGIRPFINLAIDHIRAERSQILYFDDLISLDSLEGSLNFELALEPTRGLYRGDLQLRDIVLTIAEEQLPATNLTAQFRLEDTRILLDLAALESDWLTGRVSGIIDGYQSLDHRLDIHLDLDSATLSRVYSLATPLAGRLRLTGTARGSRGNYGLLGQVQAEELRIGDYLIDGPGADIRLDGTGAEISQISGSFQSVPFQGSGKLQWKADQISTFQWSSGSLLRHSLLGSFRPYATLQRAARLGGEVRFPGLSLSEWSAAGNLEFPATLVKKGEPPLAPQLMARALWEADASGLRVDDCRIELEATLIRCQGTVQSLQDYQFHFDLESQGTAELIEWAKSWLPLVDPQAVGPITGEGMLQGRAGKPLKWTSQTALSQLWYQEWMLGGAKVDLHNDEDGSWQVALKLDGQGAAGGSVSAILDHQEVPLRSVQGRLEGQIGLLLDQQLGLQNSRAEATVDFLVERDLEGHFSGGISLEGEDWTVAGQSFPGVEAKAELRDLQLHLEHLRLRLPGGGIVQANGSIDLEHRAHRLELLGRNLELSQLTLFAAPMPVTGIIQVTGSSSGTQWPPAFSLQASSATLEVANRSFGPVSVQFDHLEGSPQSQLKGTFRHQEQPFSFEGVLDVATPFRFQIASRLTGLPLASVLEFTPLATGLTDTSLAGSLSGQVRFSGLLSEPELEAAQINLDEVVLVVSDLELRNQGIVTITLADDQVVLQEVKLAGVGSMLSLRGEISLGDDPALSLRAEGTAALDMLNPFLKTTNLGGRADVQLALGGTWQRPRLVGEVNVTDATIQHPALPARLSQVQGRLRFTADQIAIENLQATTSYGQVEAQGGVFLDGLTPSRWLLHIAGQDLRIEYPDDLHSILDVELDLVRGEGIPQLSGIVHLRSADFAQDVSLSDLVLSTSQLTPAATGGLGGAELGLNISVNAYRAIRIENNLADISASGDLKLRGTLANPILQGSLTIDEGRLFLERNEYRIVRGGVNFADPRRTRPVLNFEAETQVQDFDIGVLVNGPLDRLNVNFRADPPLPTPNILSLLALGQTGDDLFQGGTNQRAESFALYGAGALLNQRLNESLQGQSNRLFGLDRISIDPFLSSAERDPGARVTLGKSLGNRLSVTYSTDLGSESQGQIVVIQWRLTDWLTAVGTGEQNGTLAIDFKLRRRF